jgi:DMSO/TMAO reductase YedYZ molybdopterin-dependent catalytic subunit
MMTRRTLFGAALGGLAFAQQKRDMIVKSTRPEDLEMPLSGFADYITPPEHFFVRTHVYEPKVDLASWSLKVEGAVGNPLTLTLDQLRSMPSVELVAVTECAGNGRGLYEPSVPGLQWKTGGVANARWRGVRLGEVLKRAGVKSSGTEVLFDGADEPIGKMQDFRRSITMQKAMDENTLLAYEMNGAAVPQKHGFPLRVIVPGWASDSWVKWLTSVNVLEKEWDGFWMKNAYRQPLHPVAPRTSVPPDQMVPVTSLKVKSLIWSPVAGASIEPGSRVTIRGTAWSGDQGPVTGVQVSVDNGRSWRLAELARDQFTQFGWRQFEYEWSPRTAGYYTVMARANDANGNTQPLAQEWQPSGYGWNVVASVGVNVGGATVSRGDTVDAYPAESAEFKRACTTCHEMNVITQQRLSRAAWDREITKMTNWGAQVKPEDRDRFLDYLFANFGPGKPKP